MTSSGIFERGGCLVRTGLRLGQVVQRRPAGVTGHQWNTASRVVLDFVVSDAGTGEPVFVVCFDDPVTAAADGRRAERAVNAVCDVAGLSLLRIESSVLGRPSLGRRTVEYVLDARSFAAAMAGYGDAGGPAPSFREIVGRLPDGRDGFVNDLGALARAAAIEAYAARHLADPLLRGLHVVWLAGPAEGWGWLEVGAGRCLFERIVLHPRRLDCGVEPGQFAEDLAALAVGERLRELEAGAPVLSDRGALARDLDQLRLRRAELAEPSATDHILI